MVVFLSDVSEAFVVVFLSDVSEASLCVSMSGTFERVRPRHEIIWIGFSLSKSCPIFLLRNCAIYFDPVFSKLNLSKEQ